MQEGGANMHRAIYPGTADMEQPEKNPCRKGLTRFHRKETELPGAVHEDTQEKTPLSRKKRNNMGDSGWT